MYKKLFKFAVLSITILTAELFANLTRDYLAAYKWTLKPIQFTLLSMAIIMLVFYPLLIHFEKWVNKVSKSFIEAGHSIFGKYFGLVVMYLIAIAILSYFYAKMWYNINLIDYVLRGPTVSAH